MRSSGAGERFPPVRKSLGQHFLADHRVLEKIVDAARLSGSETVIEIGPGRGALTDLLVGRAGRLIAIEYDRALAAGLRVRYAMRSDVQIVEADVLAVDLAQLAGGPYRLLGNVPYYITTPILFQALQVPRPELAIYLVQREVADRIVALPGGGEYGALTVNIAAVADAEFLFKVPAGAFRPPPKVESAVVRITPKASPLVESSREDELRTFVQAVFAMRRKQIQRIIRSLKSLDQAAADAVLAACGIDPTRRPETLSPEEFARLFGELRVR
jgi:16S rRNA (adenine1518-N6/adenine1519-N6)-dimethyltransferase